MKLPDAEVCHITKGRVRIKIPSKKGNKSFFDELRNTLINDGFAKEVSINPSISSFILYTEENLDNIKTYAREKNLFELKTIDEEKRKVINYTIKQAYNNLDSKLKRFFNNEIDLGSTVFLTLIGLTIYQIARGNFSAPAWYTSLWYAFNIFLKSDKGGG